MDSELVFSVVLTGIYIGIIVFWFWSLIDILKSNFEGANKVIWLLVVFFLSLLGSILYVFIGRKQRIIKNKN